MCESEVERIRRRQEYLDSEIRSLAKHTPETVFKTANMIYFREVEDLIAHILQSKYKTFKLPAWRYYCREDGPQGTTKPQNRLYYLIEASHSQLPEAKHYIKLVAGEATDYSGHGSMDMELAEHFIQNWLHLPIEERPLSYLLDEIKSERNKKRTMENNRKRNLKEVRTCIKCGRTLPENSKAKNCPYCGGNLTVKYVPKAEAKE